MPSQCVQFRVVTKPKFKYMIGDVKNEILDLFVPYVGWPLAVRFLRRGSPNYIHRAHVIDKITLLLHGKASHIIMTVYLASNTMLRQPLYTGDSEIPTLLH